MNEGPGWQENTRGVLGQIIVTISCQNKYYEIILLPIWYTVVIYNFQLEIKSGKKYQETI